MAVRTDAEQKELDRIWDAQEKELAELGRKTFGGDALITYLEEDILEIKREQYLSDGKWSTSKYILVTGIGGPHVEFDTNGLISVYWAGGVQEYVTYDKDALGAIQMISEYLDETP